ncbi:MAG: adenine nucleotide alpha hydrolase family protein [Desulfovibrionales bacterium]|jgi:uncharacterized protein (TIGR00269 family)|nr:adenine nucleotide alpha hydrolase family protein [Desulfovibrionales bacterium]
MKCTRCKIPAVVALPSHNAAFCKDCYLLFAQRLVERAIKEHQMCDHADRILVAISGGKDSLALSWQLKTLGYDISGLHIDLGIPESSPIARQYSERFCDKYEIPLHVLQMTDLHLSMKEVKKRVKRPICSVCGQVKRYFFNKFAVENQFSVVATGHNLDDETSRLLANVMRWDMDYLHDLGPVMPAKKGFAKKIKPLFRLSEFETANLCFLAGIDYGYAPCPYSSKASFPVYKNLLLDLEDIQPGRKIHFYDGFLKRGRKGFMPMDDEDITVHPCVECGYPTSTGQCGVCRLRSTMS